MAQAISIAILANAAQAKREIGSVSDTAEKSTGRLRNSIGKAGKVIALGLGAGLVGAAAAGKEFAQAAIEDEKSAARMAQTFTKAAGATKGQIAATESWITAQGKALGVADDDLRPALSRLVTATKDVGKAQKLTKLAMDISAGSGKSPRIRLHGPDEGPERTGLRAVPPRHQHQERRRRHHHHG